MDRGRVGLLSNKQTTGEMLCLHLPLTTDGSLGFIDDVS